MGGQQPLYMTIGELRALVAEVWETFPDRITITVTPAAITVSQGPDRSGAAVIYVDQRIGVDEYTDPARVIVASAAKRIAEDLDLRRRVVTDAEHALERARRRIADAEALQMRVAEMLAPARKDGAA